MEDHFTVIKVGDIAVINFMVGAIVDWDPKVNDPLHPKERFFKKGPFVVVEIISHGKANDNPCSIGKFTEQVVRIIRTTDLEKRNSGENVPCADISAVFLCIFKNKKEKRNKRNKR